VVLALSLMSVGCRGVTDVDVPDLVDGTYSVALTRPVIVDEFVTPSWMRNELSIDFTINGASALVTGSANDLVVVGAPLLFHETPDGWTARFSWSGLHDGNHYWLLSLTGEECLMAQAVDADLDVGPGLFTVDLRGCALQMR
jgi:hypothetical protein